MMWILFIWQLRMTKVIPGGCAVLTEHSMKVKIGALFWEEYPLTDIGTRKPNEIKNSAGLF